MNQANISPELSALFTLQRAASSGLASFKTPDGGATIAAKLAQQGEPPQDPNVMGIAQNVQQAGPTMQQNAQNAQAQQVAQQAAGIMQQQQQAQPQPPQGMAHGGIAALPASNMQNFRQGGVLGFSGVTENNPVPAPELSEEEQAAKQAQVLAMISNTASAEDQPPAERAQVLVPPPTPIEAAYADPSRRLEGVERLAPAAAITRALQVAGQPGISSAATAKAEAPPSAEMMDIQNLRAEAKAQRERKVPEVANRETLLQEFDKKYKNPSVEQRESLRGIGGLQEQVLARQQALYEKEKAGRYSEGLGEYLRGAAAGPGRGPAAAAAYDEKIRAREVGRTKEMTDNIDFQKGLVALQHTTNKDEHTEMLKRVADTVTDSAQAAALFERDRSALLKSLTGELGPAMQAEARKYAADVRSADKEEQLRKEERVTSEATAAKLKIAEGRNRTALAVADMHLKGLGIERNTDESRRIKNAIPAVLAEHPELTADSPLVANLAYQKVIGQKGAGQKQALDLRAKIAEDKYIADNKLMATATMKPEEKEAWEKTARANYRKNNPTATSTSTTPPPPPPGFVPK